MTETKPGGGLKGSGVFSCTALIDIDNSTQQFGYDALDRLTSAEDSAGTFAALAYAYDANGNRLSETRAGTPTAYDYAADSNRLIAVGAEDRTVDAAGQTTYVTGLGDLSYDGYGRLAAVPGRSASYTYDAYNRRLKKTVTGAITSFHYLPTGELLTEVQGGVPRDYVYLNGVLT